MWTREWESERKATKGISRMIDGEIILRQIRLGFSYDSADNDSAKIPSFSHSLVPIPLSILLRSLSALCGEQRLLLRV